MKQIAAAAVQTADRASDTVDAHASSHALSTAHSVLQCGVATAALAAAVQMSSQLCAVALPNYYALFSAQPTINICQSRTPTMCVTATY